MMPLTSRIRAQCSLLSAHCVCDHDRAQKGYAAAILHCRKPSTGINTVLLGQHL